MNLYIHQAQPRCLGVNKESVWQDDTSSRKISNLRKYSLTRGEEKVKRTIETVWIWRLGTKNSINEVGQTAVSAVGFYDFSHTLAFL